MHIPLEEACVFHANIVGAPERVKDFTKTLWPGEVPDGPRPLTIEIGAPQEAAQQNSWIQSWIDIGIEYFSHDEDWSGVQVETHSDSDRFVDIVRPASEQWADLLFKCHFYWWGSRSSGYFELAGGREIKSAFTKGMGPITDSLIAILEKGEAYIELERNVEFKSYAMAKAIGYFAKAMDIATLYHPRSNVLHELQMGSMGIKLLEDEITGKFYKE